MNNPEVWLFYPREDHGDHRTTRNEIKARCSDSGWGYRELSTTRIVLSEGRPIRKITPEDATNLYRSVHTRRIGILQVDVVDAPVIPNPRNVPKHYLQLHRFIRYKAFHRRIDPKKLPEEWTEFVRLFGAWIETTECLGESDPRCLPFHVFVADNDQYDLSNGDDRRRFEVDHGRQSSRRDDRDRLWKRPPPQQMHGQPILQVAGRELTQGFHWDVNSQGKCTISNTWERWEVRRNGYVNVYPNAHIRGSPTSKRLFQAKTKPA